MPIPSYLADRSPGRGALPARASFESDAASVSLNGPWSFRLRPTADVPVDDELPRDDLDESGWDSIEVPSSWVLDAAGRFGHPAYTNVQFPFPLDPPHVPDENPTGEYRRRVDVPEDFAAGGRAVLRFDGVESAYAVWMNGVQVGVGKGSRLAHEFDVTDLLRAGENTVAVRVHQWSDASYLEDQDQWWLPGIFRDVTLVSRPAGGIDDLWLRTSWRDGVAAIDLEIVADADSFPVRLRIAALGVDVEWADAAAVAPLTVPGAAPWSAESPTLYDATVTSTGEQVSLRLGFRTIEIVGDQLLANGRRLVFHGMNRHETHPDRGRVFDEAHARADLARMKRHNVNAIRTSHYPPHPRLLDLADELGLWVVLECDLETHGFQLGSAWQGHGADAQARVARLADRDGGLAAPGPAAWAGNPSDDLDWRAAYLDRIERTVERDKNHACVVLWSLGNESGTGVNLAAMAAWVHDRDPSRPVHYEGDYAGAYTDVYSRMYPPVPEVASIGGDDTGLLLGCSAAESARQRAKPFLLCEYVHAMGNGPGGIAQYEELLDRYPRLHGGFVWEWRDHGIRTHTPEGVEYFAYGGDFGEVVHDGNFVMDGMLLSDDTPTASLHEFAAVSAPFRIEADAGGVRITSRRHDRGTDDVEVRWRAERDGEPIARGTWQVDIAAGASSVVPIPQVPAGDGETWLTVEVVTRDASAWAAAGHVVASGQIALSSSSALAPAPVAVSTALTVGPATIGPAEFVHGELKSLCGMAAQGPTLELFRAPTDNDSLAASGSYDLVDPVRHPHGTPAPPVADTWRAAGLDRLVSRLIDRAATPTGLRETRRWAAAAVREYVLTQTSWTAVDDGVLLTVDVLPSAGWDMIWPRIGIRIGLPADLETAEWFGLGPHESYPDSLAAAQVGTWRSPMEELTTRYARPQESGHRSAVRTLHVTGPGASLHMRAIPDSAGRLPGFTLRRHTPQQVEAARHPHELPPATRTWLTIDAAQHGLGSRACGPDVWPDAALRPEARTIRVVFSR